MLATKVKSPVVESPSDIGLEEFYRKLAGECVEDKAINKTIDERCLMKVRTDNLNISLNCEYLNGLMCSYPNPNKQK